MKKILLAAFLMIIVSCSKQEIKEVNHLRFEKSEEVATTKKPRDWSVTTQQGDCTLTIYAWTTFSILGHMHVWTWQYDIILTCGGNSVTTHVTGNIADRHIIEAAQGNEQLANALIEEINK